MRSEASGDYIGAHFTEREGVDGPIANEAVASDDLLQRYVGFAYMNEIELMPE